MKNRVKIIIGIIITIAILLIGRFGYSIYKEHQMNKLITISSEMFDKYIEKGKTSYAQKNMTATYTPNEIVIVAGDKKEFVSLTYFEVDIDVNGEKDYTNTTHKMRIKKDKDGEYKVIDEGNLVNVEGLKLVNYSNKQKEKEELEKTKKEIAKNKYEKSAGIYYTVEPDKIRLSYDKKKTWVDVPIDSEFIKSNAGLVKLKENTYYISHKKTAFISTNEEDIRIVITNDKGKTWETINISDGYRGGDLFIGFSSEEVGYYVVTTDIAMGKQNSYINITTDGGKTWKEIGNANEVYPYIITGVGFIDDKIGFLSYRSECDDNPTVYRTEDSGNTWTKLDIKLPSEYLGDYVTPMSVEITKGKAVLPVKLKHNNIVVKFITDDKGLTWKYSGTNS